MPLLTVDLEEWFHVCGHPFYDDPERWEQFESRVAEVTAEILETLAANRSRATFFVLGWIARRHPRLVRDIVAAGHEIASHGDLHRRASSLGLEEFEADLRRSLAALEPLAGSPIRGYRAAEWSIRHASDPRLEVLARHGIVYDSSITAMPAIGRRLNPRHPYRVSAPASGDWKQGGILELPPLSYGVLGWAVPAGGSWPLRLAPLAWARRAAERAENAGHPAIFVVHPWEVDRRHPPMALTGVARFVHFAGRARYAEKFRRLLGGWRFESIAGWMGTSGPNT